MCLEDYRRLAKVLNAPPMFLDVLPLIVRPEEVAILLGLEERKSVKELSLLLKLPLDFVDSKVQNLYRRGFLKRKVADKVYYSLKSFRSVVERYLAEGRSEHLGKYVVALAEYLMDTHVKRARKNTYPGSKVLPIPQAVIEPVSVVIPYENALSIIKRASSISLRNCNCRMTYKNCDKPLNTCIALNEFSNELIDRGVAERISLEEAKEILNIANEHGLVHQALYIDWLRGEVFDICSCCSCCCMYLRAFLNYGVKHHIAKSGFKSIVDPEKCTGCGTCVERCIFNARSIVRGICVVDEERCFGCGLCTTACPVGAVMLVRTDQ